MTQPDSTQAEGQVDMMRGSLVVLWIVTALSLWALRAPFLSLPLERDEGEYAYIAQRMLAGEVPYRDAFDQKPPLIFLVYLVTFLWLGQSIFAIHVFLLLWVALTTLLLYLLVRELADGLTATWAAFLFTVISADPRLLAQAANTEVFMLLPIVGSLLAAKRGLSTRGWGWWVACGGLAAAAVWFKPVAATQLIFLALYMLVEVRREGAGTSERAPSTKGAWRRTLLRSYLLVVLGAILASLPVVFYFFFKGAWSQFIDAVFLHNLAYVRRIGLAVGLSQLQHQLIHQAPSFAVVWGLAAAGVALSLARRQRWGALVFVWLVLSLLGVSAGLYFRGHYFIQLLPALAVLAAVPLASLHATLLRRTGAVWHWIGLTLLVATVLVPPVLANQRYLGAESTLVASRRLYDLNPFPESLVIAEYLRHRSRPEDKVLVFGSEPQILFYAQRRSATRYIFFYPLMGEFADALARQREVIREAEKEPPGYIVFVKIPTSFLAQPNSEFYLFERLQEMLAESYELEVFAFAVGPEELFRFLFDEDARNWTRAHPEVVEKSHSVAVYRLRDEGEGNPSPR